MKPCSPRRACAPLLAIVLAAAAADAPAQSGPPVMTPAQAGIAYDIVCCRMPVAGNEERDAFPDAANMSLYVGRGADLVIVHPNGTEEILHDAGPNESCIDPVVSFDGRTVYFAKWVDPEDWHPGIGWWRLSRSPCHIWKVDVATHVATQLTFGTRPAWQDSAHASNPQYGLYEMAPVELPDGRLLFLSNRDGTYGQDETYPAMKFWRMERDGTNLEPMERFSLGGCQHPAILKDGRIVWTHQHPCGRRLDGGGNYPLMVASQDLSDFKTFAGVHFPITAWHFLAQLSNGDIVTNVYYHQNNYGHGTLVRFPVDPGHPSGQLFGPANGSTNPYQYNIYGQNDHFPRIGEYLATPWSLTPFVPSLGYDESSVTLSDGTRAGKCTMPAGAPGGHLLLVWSSGRCNDLYRPQPELPHMKLCFAPNGMLAQRNDLRVLKESAQWHYLYPKPLVPYQAIYGIAKPPILPDAPNDGVATLALPAGSPFATTGTSSVYIRESRWPASYGDPWDANIVNSYALGTAFFNIGQDSYAFANHEIWAAQVVVDMTHVDTRWAQYGSHIRSHNNGLQVWGVLGEIPLRKNAPGGGPLLDPRGDPDTSYEVRIPANVPFHNRLIDRRGTMLTAEWTWHSARPGERKTNCGGCHAHSYQTQPLPFAQTAAGQPGYVIADFALQTPMVDQDAGGNPSVTVLPDRARVIEFHRDVRPILVAKCAPCHGGAAPAAGLDLASAGCWDALAFQSGPLFGFHQATRWIRRHSAAQSLLVWKLWGQRLDGRSNADRANDLDYAGEIMPPPSSGIAPLTFMEKRTLSLWIDLGCLVDLTPGAASIADPFDDQMPPTLAVSGITRRFAPSPLPPLAVGVYDVHSGVAPSSLSVQVIPAGGTPGGNLAGTMPVSDGTVRTIPMPPLAQGSPHRILVSVADIAGNVARRELTVIPVAPASAVAVGTGAPGTAGVPMLSASPPVLDADLVIGVSQARPASAVHLFFTTALAPAPVGLAPNAFLYLDPAELAAHLQLGIAPLASGTTSAAGAWSFTIPIAADPALSGLQVHFQAAVVDPLGATLAPGLQAALTAALTITIGA